MFHFGWTSRSALLTRLSRLKQLDNEMVRSEESSDDEEDDDDEDEDGDAIEDGCVSVDCKNADNTSHRKLSGITKSFKNPNLTV